jgi:hypothetical protein
MKAIKLILVLQFLFITNCYSSKDRIDISIDTLQNHSIKTSDLVFLGKLIGTDTIKETFVFNILEIFKGNIVRNTIEIKWEKHTYIYSLDYSLWIVYSNKSSDSSYVLNKTGLTRSIINPQIFGFHRLPPPPALKLDAHTIFNSNDEWMDYKINALKDWYVELEMLKEYKKKNIASTQNDNFAFKTYFYISVILNIICIALIVFVFLRLKKSLPLTNSIANEGMRVR